MSTRNGIEKHSGTEADVMYMKMSISSCKIINSIRSENWDAFISITRTINKAAPQMREDYMFDSCNMASLKIPRLPPPTQVSERISMHDKTPFYKN